MTVTLITGANKGLGYATARQLIELGHTVYMGSRDPARGAAAAEALGGRTLLVDVTDGASVQAAADRVREEQGYLDVLVNNAAIAEKGGPIEELTAADLETIYQTNVFGVVRMIQAFLPLLRAASSPRIVNVSSSLGSLDARSRDDIQELRTGRDPLLAYSSSKAALNMLTILYAQTLDVRVNAVNPGFTATDLNAHKGTKSVEEGAAIIIATATAGSDAPTGTFLEAPDTTVPW
jgi:NAD(P)-dependent dehydrogenase (short-subunit alcohol dehydrogenase family)